MTKLAVLVEGFGPSRATETIRFFRSIYVRKSIKRQNGPRRLHGYMAIWAASVGLVCNNSHLINYCRKVVYNARSGTIPSCPEKTWG